jgi:hypothetical protein
MSEPPTNTGRNRFVERDRFFIPAVRILRALANNPHAACKLCHTTGLPRETIDRSLQWLKRRRLIEHVGAWRLSEHGRAAVGSPDQVQPDQPRAAHPRPVSEGD